MKEINNLNRASTSRHSSYEDMIKDIRMSIIETKVSSSLDDSTHALKRNMVVSSTELSDAISSVCDIAVDSHQSFEDTLYIYNPVSKTMTSLIAFFEKIVADVSSHKDFQSSTYNVRLIVDDVVKMSSKIVNRLKRSSFVRRLNIIPSHYFVMSNDVVIDLKSKTLVEIDDIINTYDIISKSPVRHIATENLSKSDLAKMSLFESIIERIFNDWSDGDESLKLLLFQLAFAVLQHDNHNKCAIIKGPGGNGKSTYMNLLSKLSGYENTEYINIHQFGDHHSINNISSSTRLIIGDDAATNHKLSDVALSNLKSIITGDPISVNVKYKDNVIIRSKALFVQGTNTDISFYENNPALKSRMLVIDWSDTDFRSNKPADVTFNLDELLEDQLFIDVFAKKCVESIDYFTQFTIPDKVVKSTNEMIESNDTIKQFLDDVFSQVNTFPMIPINVIYHCYLDWSKHHNSKGGVMKSQTFTKSLSRYENEFQFTLSDRSKRRTFQTNKSVKSMIEILQIESRDVNLRSQQLYLEPNNPVSIKEVLHFDIDSLDIENLSMRDEQLLLRKAYECHDSQAISLTGQLLN